MVEQVSVPSNVNPMVLTNPLKETWTEVVRSRGRAYLQVALLFYISHFLHLGKETTLHGYRYLEAGGVLACTAWTLVILTTTSLSFAAMYYHINDFLNVGKPHYSPCSPAKAHHLHVGHDGPSRGNLLPLGHHM